MRTNYENMTDISLITMRESPIEQEGDKVQFDLYFYDEADDEICLVSLYKENLKTLSFA